jgi:hypothetical protein
MMNENFRIILGIKDRKLDVMGRGGNVVDPEGFFSDPDLTFQIVLDPNFF